MSQERYPAPKGAYVQTRQARGLCFVSGQVPVDPDGRPVDSDNLVAQTEQVFANLEACLAAEGLALSDVVSVTTYVRDVVDAATIGAIRGRLLGDNRPTSTVIEVSNLLDPNWRLEVAAVASCPDTGAGPQGGSGAHH